MKLSPARKLALEIGAEARRREAFVRELIDSRRATTTLSAEDFNFAQVLAFGVCMCEGTLDEFINLALAKPNAVKPKLRDALRISAYELLFLDKPAHVVVSQGVELARAVTPHAAGFANATLRKMAAGVPEFPQTPAHQFGVPTWLQAKLAAQYGEEQAAEILAACLQPAPTYLHENPFNEGAPFASDLSAKQVATLVPLSEPILEIGAGRGTKTLLLQARAHEEVGRQVQIHTVDIHAFKARLHEGRMQEQRITAVSSHVGDATNLAAIEGLASEYPTIFIDAPCSGSGTLRRHPENRWRRSEADVAESAALQLQTPKSAATKLAPGGTLVYATCSIFEEENQQVTAAFLNSAQAQQAHIQQAAATFQTLPKAGGPDGHFAATFTRAA